MSDDKRKEFGLKGKGPEKDEPTGTSRARNRTVLLTPEVAGQVRALLNKEEDKVGADPLSDILPPVSWDNPPPSPPIDRPTTTWSSEALASEAEKGGFGMRKPGSGLGQTPRGNERTSAPLGSPTAASSRPPAPAQGFNPTQHVIPTAPATPAPGPQFGVGFSATHMAPPPPQQQPTVHQASAVPPQHAQRARKGTGTFQVTPQTKLIGFLVSYDGNEHGEVVEVRVGRWLLTSRASEHGDHILIDDDSISPLHAIVRASKEGKVQVLDQLSEFGTGVTPVGTDKEDEVTGSMATLNHGDLVRFGKRRFVVCLVPAREVPKPAEAEAEAE